MGHEHCQEDHCHSDKSQESCCCHEKSACCSEQGQCGGDFAHRLLQLADEAWYELLKEKIKAEIANSESGKSLDAIAKLVSETNRSRWMHKMAKKQRISEFKGRLQGLLHG